MPIASDLHSLDMAAAHWRSNIVLSEERVVELNRDIWWPSATSSTNFSKSGTK